jgi:tetratricopeptide (TPR) repeat protein
MALRAEFLWSSGSHEELRVIAAHLAKDHSSTLGYLYLAQCAHVHGNLDEAIGWLKELLTLNPDHSDAIHLLALCHEEQGNREQAWQTLSALALRRLRVKTWQYLANLVNDEVDFRRLLTCHGKAVASGVIPAGHWEILNHLSLGAMRAGDYESAKTLWRGIVRDRCGSSLRARPRRPKIDIYSPDRAERALLDLNKVFKDAGIEMFLVSGTLLGCMRERRLLGHDKDIDVGIWEDVAHDRLTAAVKSSGLFNFIASRCADIVRLRHVNGIPLDVFYHHREVGTCWHGGVKMRWHNTPFTLAEVEFLGDSFKVPLDYRQYFIENYGDDWEVSKPDFDSAFDTPNGKLTNLDELIVYSYRQLFANLNKGSEKKVDYYLSKLDQLGECELAWDVKNASRDKGAEPGNIDPARPGN